MANNNSLETNLGFIIEQVAKEKSIEKDVLLRTIEAAIVKAAQGVFGMDRELEARFNEATGQVDLFLYMTVVDDVANPDREISLEDAKEHNLEAELGEELGFQIFWHPADAAKAKQQDEDYGDLLDIQQARSTFGRIAAQTAKQVLLARVRDAERDQVYNAFKDRMGELVKGFISRMEKDRLIIDLGNNTEGVLSAREQTPRETFRPRDRIVALVKTIDREARGPQVILSRQDPRLVVKLFEAEVPEIYDGTVRIVSVARDAGVRSKIAVVSRNADVDPVGACVGMKGSRVQAVVQELRGEKIDIVPYDDDPARYVISSVQPAEVVKVIVDEPEHRMELVVPDEKLSLAIGRKGQNVRLASQLTGWKLDIISESKFRQIEDRALASLQQIPEVDESLARVMYRAGFRTVEEIAEASLEDLSHMPGIANEAMALSLQRGAETALETQRVQRIQSVIHRPEAVPDTEKMALVRGMSDRTLEQLVEGGYRSIEAFVRDDPEKIAGRSGVQASRVLALQESAREFLANDWKAIDAERVKARASRAALLADGVPLPGGSSDEVL